MRDWHQTLVVHSFILVLGMLVLAFIEPAGTLSYMLGSLIMMVAYAVSAKVHFQGGRAPSAGFAFQQAARAVVLRFVVLILGVMLTLRYFGRVQGLFFIVGALITQQSNWIVPMWRAYKGKD